MYDAMVSCDFFLEQLGDAERSYIASFVAHGFTGVASAYIERGCVDPEQDLRAKLHMLFSGEYIPRS